MSSKKPRLKREDPDRTGPHRNFGQLFRDADSWDPDQAGQSAEGGNGAGNEQPWEGAISRAVETGYRVIEKEISQGRKAALEFAEKLTKPGDEDGDVSGLIGRIVNFYSDLGALWIEMLQSLARNPALLNIVRSASKTAADPTGASPTETGDAASGSVPVEIISSEPTGARVSLKIDDGALGGTLRVYELRASDPKRRPLPDVVFEPGTDRWHPILRITIPKGQAPGTYSGVVIDARTDEPCGTLCVRIPEPDEAASD